MPTQLCQDMLCDPGRVSPLLWTSGFPGCARQMMEMVVYFGQLCDTGKLSPCPHSASAVPLALGWVGLVSPVASPTFPPRA